MKPISSSVRFFATSLMALVVVLTIVGCGGKHAARVNGNVTLDGEPVPRGTVVFVPTGGGPTALSPIDDSGGYLLRTGQNASLPPGEYEVTVAANEVSSEGASKYGGPPPLGKPITPSRYRRRDTSGLNFTVEPGRNEINLELTSN